MTLGITYLTPTLAIVVGLMVLFFPKFLNYFVAAYLIIVGLVGLGIIR